MTVNKDSVMNMIPEALRPLLVEEVKEIIKTEEKSKEPKPATQEEIDHMTNNLMDQYKIPS